MDFLRPELRNGLLVLCCFLLTVIATDFFIPNQLDLFDYQIVNSDDLVENPSGFEGKLISIGVSISTISSSNSTIEYYAITSKNITLLVPFSLSLLQEGDRANIRGISLLQSQGYIEVHDLHVADSVGPILRSIPGIIGLVVLLFMIFRLNLRKLAFEPRSESHA
jgi:hypothetical protein